MKGLVRRDGQPSTLTSRTNTASLLASTNSSKKRRKRRKSTGPSRVYNNVFENLGTKRAVTPVEEDVVAPQSESTKPNTGSVDRNEKMPSIFTRKEEIIYDKYAACLAATESLRRARDAVLDKNRSAVNVKSMAKFWNRDSHERNSEDYHKACAQYVLQSGKMVRSMGLSVSQFNQLGREVETNKTLKLRVMEQAYLYRMAATVNMGKIALIEDPNSKHLLKSHRRQRLQMFVKSITEIEDLRTEQIKRLQNALSLDVLPSSVSISDPALLPILDPKIRAVVEAFPLQAEEIVKKYGLNSNEFNQMLEESKNNPIFRNKVKKYMQKHDSLVKGFDDYKVPENP